MDRAALAEAMVPVACDLACRVRDGDAEGIGRLARANGWDQETSALLVVLAAMVPVEDATPNELLAWTGGLEAAMAWPQEPLPFGGGLEPCGTYAAAARHARHGEPLDPACEQARRAYKLGRQRARTERLRRAAGGSGSRRDEAAA